jgi:hypothetical protein
MRSWPIPQIGLVVVGIVFAATAAAVVLTLANFSRAMEDTVESRFQFLSREVRDTIETGLSLGLGLDELTNVQAIIDERTAQDPAILRIVVRNSEGEVHFESAPPATTESNAGDGTTGQGGAEPVERARVTDPLVNSFGQTVGTVELIYATGSYRDAIARVRESLLHYGLVIAAVCSLLAVACIALVLRNLPRTLRRIRARFADGAADGGTDSDLERNAAEAVGAMLAAGRQLDGLARQLPERDAPGPDMSGGDVPGRAPARSDVGGTA